MRFRFQPVLALMVVLSASSPCLAQVVPLPSKITVIKDIQLPVPFAVNDSIQAVSAGTEVELKAVDGERVKVAFGVGEGFIQVSDTDFLDRAKTLKQQLPASPPSPAPGFSPYEMPVQFERLTPEEHEERQSELVANREAEEEKQRIELEKKEREEMERKEAQGRAKVEEEAQRLEAEREKAEQERIAAQEQAVKAQSAALDAQILAARQTVYRLQGALIGPDAGVKIGPNGVRDVRERANMERELRVAQMLLQNLEKARAQTP